MLCVRSVFLALLFSPAVLPAGDVITGIDVLQRDGFAALQGQRVGLITNHTGVNQEGIRTVQLLRDAEGVDLQILFSPEHGFAGKLDTSIIGNATDAATGLKVFSLYGKTRTPSAESLQNLDVLVFDVQDVGARFYTYISTMGHAMQAAAEHDVAFVVLDRPNPITGTIVAGPVLDEGAESFVGFHAIAVRHGMTAGELATMFRDERKLDLDLSVIRMQNWNRSHYFDATGLLWINPSPNMRNLNEAVLYPGIGLLETTNLSVGRGTDTPFEVLGAPWIDARRLAGDLNAAGLPGVVFVPIRFTPDSSKFASEKCGGVNLLVTDRAAFQSVRTGLTIAHTLRTLYPDDWDTESFNRLLSNQQTFNAIVAGRPIDQIEEDFTPALRAFEQRRKKYLLY